MNVELYQMTCCSCKIAFWITNEHDDRLRKSHDSFWCPNGHSQSYQGESDEAKIARLSREKRELQATIDMKDRQLKACEKKPRKKRTIKKK